MEEKRATAEHMLGQELHTFNWRGLELLPLDERISWFNTALRHSCHPNAGRHSFDQTEACQQFYVLKLQLQIDLHTNGVTHDISCFAAGLVETQMERCLDVLVGEIQHVLTKHGIAGAIHLPGHEQHRLDLGIISTVEIVLENCPRCSELLVAIDKRKCRIGGYDVVWRGNLQRPRPANEFVGACESI